MIVKEKRKTNKSRLLYIRMEKGMKRLPIGTQAFEKLRNDNSVSIRR
jgi:hypothetical protein